MTLKERKILTIDNEILRFWLPIVIPILEVVILNFLVWKLCIMNLNTCMSVTIDVYCRILSFDLIVLYINMHVRDLINGLWHISSN